MTPPLDDPGPFTNKLSIFSWNTCLSQVQYEKFEQWFENILYKIVQTKCSSEFVSIQKVHYYYYIGVKLLYETCILFQKSHIYNLKSLKTA